MISINEVTFLHNVHKDFFIDKSGKSNYFSFKEFDSYNFNNFISTLNSNSLYSIVPMISINNTQEEPYIVLSRTILVTKYSDYKTIHKYICDRFNFSLDLYKIDELEDYNIVFKFKKVRIDISQLRKFK